MSLSFDLLEPGLGLSARPHAARDLDDTPFAAILNVADAEMPRYALGLSAGIELIRRPINDIYPEPLPRLVLPVLELAELRRRGVSTLVHCQAGVSRSPTVIALYWMARDGLDWDAAVARLVERRPIVEPNVYFSTDRNRARVVAAVRDFLAGSHDLLAAARIEREAFVRRLTERVPDPAGADDGWNLIEAGLALGADPAAPEGYDIVRTGSPPDGDGLYAWLIEVSDEIAVRRRASGAVAVIDDDDGYAAALATCAHIMRTQHRDIASTLWYVGTRYQSLWRHVGALWRTDWDALLDQA